LTRERTDRELLAAHLGGDEEAFEELASRHAAMVLAACRRQLGEGPDAEDAAQAAFVVMVRKAGSLSRGSGDLGAWLHRAASNVARTARRARATRARHEKEAAAMRLASGERSEAGALWRENREHLDAALDSLPEGYRQTLVLCYFEGLSQSQAAARLAIPESTVATRCARGLEKLRARLAARGGRRARRTGGAALGSLIAEQAAKGAERLPPAFVPSVVSAAKGAAASASILALTEGALSLMMWNKLKTIGLYLAAAAVLAAATPLAVVAASGEKIKPPPAVDGLRVTLTADRTEFSPGEKVKLTLTFENVSKAKMRVFLPPANWLDRNLTWNAEGPGAQRMMVARNLMARLSGLGDFPELAPGAKKAVSYQLSGNPPGVTGWQLTKSGEYKLSASYRYNMVKPVYHQGAGGPVAAPFPGPGAPRGGAPAGGRGPKPVPGKVWKGTVSTNELKLKLKKYDPAKGIDGLTVKISADKKAAKVGDAVTVKVTFKNVSKAAMKICNYKLAGCVKITGPDEESVVRAFSTARTGVWRPSGPVAGNFIELAPGAEKSFTVKIAGNPPSVAVPGASSRTFLTKGGKYKISIFYRNRWNRCASARPGGRWTKVAGKVWTGAVGSEDLEVDFKGQPKPVPAGWRKAGKLGPGMIVPGGAGGGGGGLRPAPIRPMGAPEKKKPIQPQFRPL
jgi:RNA polymerase sigma factor (sigma-70 family)